MGCVEKNFEEDSHKVMQIGIWVIYIEKHFEGDSHKVMQMGICTVS